MDKKINNNGFEYVDLELPSGTLWATCNVGASKHSGFGLYFQWGDTNGYAKDQVGKNKQFHWNDYKWNPLGDCKTFTKYTSAGEALELEDDAAHINMGGDWHMPTNDQIIELLDNKTSTWTAQDGVKGRLFTSKKDETKSIFIPASGYAWDGSIYNSGKLCYAWSSMLSSKYVNYGMSFNFFISRVYESYYYRSLGFPIRGVIG